MAEGERKLYLAIESTAELSVQKAKVTTLPFPRLLCVSHRIFSGGDHEVVEGRVAEVEHLCHPPYQQGQIRRPLVYVKDIFQRPQWTICSPLV